MAKPVRKRPGKPSARPLGLAGDKSARLSLAKAKKRSQVDSFPQKQTNEAPLIVLIPSRHDIDITALEQDLKLISVTGEPGLSMYHKDNCIVPDETEISSSINKSPFWSLRLKPGDDGMGLITICPRNTFAALDLLMVATHVVVLIPSNVSLREENHAFDPWVYELLGQWRGIGISSRIHGLVLHPSYTFSEIGDVKHARTYFMHEFSAHHKVNCMEMTQTLSKLESEGQYRKRHIDPNHWDEDFIRAAIEHNFWPSRASELHRGISRGIIATAWRSRPPTALLSSRAFMVSHSIRFDGSVLRITGVMRGEHFLPGDAIHITGAGDFAVSAVEIQYNGKIGLISGWTGEPLKQLKPLKSALSETNIQHNTSVTYDTMNNPVADISLESSDIIAFAGDSSRRYDYSGTRHISKYISKSTSNIGSEFRFASESLPLSIGSMVDTSENTGIQWDSEDVIEYSDVDSEEYEDWEKEKVERSDYKGNMTLAGRRKLRERQSQGSDEMETPRDMSIVQRFKKYKALQYPKRGMNPVCYPAEVDAMYDGNSTWQKSILAERKSISPEYIINYPNNETEVLNTLQGRVVTLCITNFNISDDCALIQGGALTEAEVAVGLRDENAPSNIEPSKRAIELIRQMNVLANRSFLIVSNIIPGEEKVSMNFARVSKEYDHAIDLQNKTQVIIQQGWRRFVVVPIVTHPGPAYCSGGKRDPLVVQQLSSGANQIGLVYYAPCSAVVTPILMWGRRGKIPRIYRDYALFTDHSITSYQDWSAVGDLGTIVGNKSVIDWSLPACKRRRRPRSEEEMFAMEEEQEKQECGSWMQQPIALLAKGQLGSCGIQRHLLKRVILSGEICKLIGDNRCRVRFMFNNADDVAHLGAASLVTKKGAIGIVERTVGSHGDFIARFTSKVSENDRASLRLYKRQFPKYCSSAWRYKIDM